MIVVVNLLTSKIDELNAKVDKPKPVIKKFQILLFPERDAKLFYKIVFGP